LAVNLLLVASIAKNMLAQLPLVLSVWLFILNVPVPLLQNDPNGNYEFVLLFTIVPTEYLLYREVFEACGPI
jgi:hypothetical protein